MLLRFWSVQLLVLNVSVSLVLAQPRRLRKTLVKIESTPVEVFPGEEEWFRLLESSMSFSMSMSMTAAAIPPGPSPPSSPSIPLDPSPPATTTTTAPLSSLQTAMEVIANGADTAILELLLNQANLTAKGTVFAPPNAAFGSIDADRYVQEDYHLHLASLLGLHYSAQIAENFVGQSIPMANGDDITLLPTNQVWTPASVRGLEGQALVGMSQTVSDGIIYNVNKVLRPLWMFQSASDHFPASMVEFAKLAGLDWTNLEDQTVLAPSDAAWGALTDEQTEFLRTNPQDLRNLLSFHVLSQVVTDSTTGTIPTLLAGRSVTLADGKADQAVIQEVRLFPKGTVLIVDRLLLPQ